jgi:hypothetical protein
MNKLLIVFFGAFLIVSCEWIGREFNKLNNQPTNQDSAKPLSQFDSTKYSPETWAYFKEITLGNEFSHKDSKTPYRWTKNMKIFCYGYCPPMMMNELDRIVQELNQLIDPITISIVSKRSEANFIIYLGSYEYFARIHPDIDEKLLVNNWGYFEIYPSNKGIMYVDVLRAKEEDARKHLLRVELTQSLGLVNDSYKYDYSIFYQGWTTITEYAPIDRDLIKILYNR